MAEDESKHLYFSEFNIEDLTALSWEEVDAWPLDFCRAIQGIFEVASTQNRPTGIAEIQNVARSLSDYGATVWATLTRFLSDGTLEENHPNLRSFFSDIDTLMYMTADALSGDDALTVDVVAGASEFWEAWRQRGPWLEPRGQCEW